MELYLHHSLTHLSLPSLNLTQVKQNTVAIPEVLVAVYLLVALVAEVAATGRADHMVAALTALYVHAAAETLLAGFLQVQKQSLTTAVLQKRHREALMPVSMLARLYDAADLGANLKQCAIHTSSGSVPTWT